MGWLRLVRFVKLWVSFAEYSLFYRAVLQQEERENGAREVRGFFTGLRACSCA